MTSEPAGPCAPEVRTSWEVGCAVIDKISAMVAYWDADLRCRFANRAYERWFGMRPESLLGMHISELLGPLYALNRPYIEGALRGEPQEFEREIPDPAGGPARHSLANYIPDVVDGEVRGFFVLVTDISAIKRTELALRETDERFRLTLEEAPIGMALVGTDGRFLRVNRSLCGILGYPAEELMRLTFQEITHPKDLGADLALARQLARGEIPRYTLEKRFIRKDGAVVDVELNAAVVRDAGGGPVHFIAQVEDITERKRIDNETQFLAELGPVLAASFDEDETLKRVLGLVTGRLADFCIVDTIGEGDQLRREMVSAREPNKQALVQRILDLQLDRSRPYLISEAVQTRRPVLLQYPSDKVLVQLSQGEDHLRLMHALEMVSVVAVPLIADERVVGAITLIASRGSRAFDARDVRLAEELAWRVALWMESVRLYRSAQRATAARDEVLAIVAHDLRNPLSTISMQAALLRRRSQPRAGTEAAAGDAIQRAAGRMQRLIEDLLDVSRIEAGQLSVQRAALAPIPLITECVGSQRDLALAAGIELHLDVPPALPLVSADHDRLCQVFENLIGNALKFTPRGGAVTVRAQDCGKEVLFRVTDTGAGIPPEYLPHLFDRFWQARAGERRGAGLGLSIVKGIVEAHGGSIWVESMPSQGTSFSFTVSVADGAKTALIDQAAAP